jgi:serine/threonine-protein kinase
MSEDDSEGSIEEISEQKSVCENKMLSNQFVRYQDDGEIIKIYTEINHTIYCFLPLEIMSLFQKGNPYVIIPFIEKEFYKEDIIKLLENGYSNWTIKDSRVVKYDDEVFKINGPVYISKMIRIIQDNVFDPNFREAYKSKVEYIGAGGYGDVSLIKEPSGRSFIQKKITIDVYKSYERMKKALNEIIIQLMVQDHPNICKIFGSHFRSANFENYLCIYMQVGEENLLTYKKHCYEVSDLKYIAKCIGNALIHIHKKGYLFCDLKPENVIMRKGIPLLIDFGLSVPIDSNLKSISCAGTRIYFAPECNGSSNTLKTEYYSFGIFLLELFSTYDYDTIANNKDHLEVIKLIPEFCQVQMCDEDIDEFNRVFLGLCDDDPSQRMSIEEALKSNLFAVQD